MANPVSSRSDQAKGLARVWKAWEQFWFNPGDPTTLSFMRLIGGFLIFYVHLSYSFDLQTFFGKDAWLDLSRANIFRQEVPTFAQGPQWDKQNELEPRTSEEKAFYTKWGYLPKQMVNKGRPIFSLWYHVTDPMQMRIAHGVILTSMFFFAIGFCSRATGALTWIFLLFYINRSNVSLFGMDSMMSMLAMYLIIGPSGAAFSVDRRIERWIAVRRGVPVSALAPPAPSVSANLAIRLIQINLCIVYAVSGLSKLQGGSWWNGTATWLTMVNSEFSPTNNALYMAIVRFIATRRWLWELIITSTTMMTLLLELTAPLMFWNRNLRWLYICGCCLFHLSIALFMGLVAFSAMMLVLLLSFVPGWTIRDCRARIAARLRNITKTEIVSSSHA